MRASAANSYILLLWSPPTTAIWAYESVSAAAVELDLSFTEQLSPVKCDGAGYELYVPAVGVRCQHARTRSVKGGDLKVSYCVWQLFRYKITTITSK